ADRAACTDRCGGIHRRGDLCDRRGAAGAPYARRQCDAAAMAGELSARLHHAGKPGARLGAPRRGGVLVERQPALAHRRGADLRERALHPPRDPADQQKPAGSGVARRRRRHAAHDRDLGSSSPRARCARPAGDRRLLVGGPLSTDREIQFERRGAAGVTTLNRPQALNAVPHGMVHALSMQLAAWAEDAAITRVVIRGAGERAFSAGGDIRALYELGRAGRQDGALPFWRDEYTLNAFIKRYPKPYVALIDGIV